MPDNTSEEDIANLKKTATIKYLTSLSEARLQADVVEPLLRLEGFSNVRDMSGANDKGKDLVAIKMDFGKPILYAIQIKKFRFSGKHDKPSSLSHVVNQLRQVFGEETIDPATNERRSIDRCLFITPFPISRAALESAIGQVNDLERWQVLLIDGSLLADKVLQHFPELIPRVEPSIRYRERALAHVEDIVEYSVFGANTPIKLDAIYIELSLSQVEKELLELADYPYLSKGSRFLWMNLTDIKTVRDIVNNCFSPSKSIRFLWSPPRKASKRTEAYQKFRDSLSDKARQSKVKACLRECELCLDDVMQETRRQLLDYFEKAQKLMAPTIDGQEAEQTLQMGMSIRRNFEKLRGSKFLGSSMIKSADRTQRGRETAIPRLPATIISKLSCPVFVLGAPGAGKTTLMRRLVALMSRGKVSRLPLLIYLVQFQTVQKTSLLSVIHRELTQRGWDLRKHELNDKLSNGDFRILFDGLDEAGDKAEGLLKEIHIFCAMYPKCPVVVTTRTTLEHLILSDALSVRLSPLDDTQLYAFVEKWFTAEPSKARRMKMWLRDNARMRATAYTPLVAALLCSLMHAEAELPSTEVELYEQRCELLLGRWERAKGIVPLSREMRKVYLHFMMLLAFEMHKKGMRSAPEDMVIDRALEFYIKEYHRSPVGLVRDCVCRGLLEEEIGGGYSFGHLTYQEYFVGRWLAHQNDVGYIFYKRNQVWWRKALELYAAIKGDISELVLFARRSKANDAIINDLCRLAPLTKRTVGMRR